MCMCMCVYAERHNNAHSLITISRIMMVTYTTVTISCCCDNVQRKVVFSIIGTDLLSVSWFRSVNDHLDKRKVDKRERGQYQEICSIIIIKFSNSLQICKQ